MRKVNQKIEAYLHRTLQQMKQMEADIEALKHKEETASGMEKAKFQARRKHMEEKLSKLQKKYAALYSMNESIPFTAGLVKSFQHKWIPIVALVIILAGQLTGIFDFVLTTIINAVILWAIMSVLVYAMQAKWIPKVQWELKNSTTVMYGKGIFLLVALVKILFSFLGPVWMYIIIVLGALAVALYLSRDEIKFLIEQRKNKKK